jgi:hypothetical protein
MSVEFDVDAVSGAGALGFDSLEEKEESQSTHFHQSIFVPPYYPEQFSREVALNFQTQESQNTEIVVAEKLEKDITKRDKDRSDDGPKNETRVDFNISFGPDGPQFSMTGTARTEDNNGNFVEATATYNSKDGSSDINVGGGHKDK